MNNTHWIFGLILSLIGIQLHAQTCTSQRYLDSMFVAQITNDVDIYGSVERLVYPPYISEATTTNFDPTFDFYIPQSDILTKRPLIVMSHGGAFFTGDKQQTEMVEYCTKMAERGFLVVSIEYRIGYNTTDGDTAIRAVYRGLQDFKAAVRYFRENASLYGIDPEYVFGGGNSAGSMNAMHAAYTDEADRAASPLLEPTYFVDNLFIDWPDLGPMDTSGNTFMQDSKPAAVINLWGGTVDLNWIDANEAPIISFHG